MKKVLQKFVHYFDAIDLTEGNIRKRILRFLGPIVLSLLFQQIYTLVDSMIVGQTLDEVDVAAVNNATNIIFLVIDFAIGTMSGFGVVIGELMGAKNEEGTRRCVINQIYLSFLITIFLTVGGVLLIDPLLAMIGIAPSNVDPRANGVYESARTYLLIIFGGAITQVFYNHIVSTLRSIGDSFTPFMFLLASTLLNIALDLLFIKVFGLGVAGAAFATILAQGLAAIGCYLYAYFHYPNLRPKKEDFKWNQKYILSSLKNGLPMGFSFSVLAIGIIVMQSAIDRFDVTPEGMAVAGLPAELGYGAGCKVINFLMAPLNALGMAMISFHSQNLGARNLDRIKKGFKASFLIGFVIYLIVMTIGLLLTINGAYQYFFLSQDKITAASIRYGNTYIYIAMPCFFFLMVLFLLRNTLQGLEKTIPNFLSGVGELVARVLICYFLPYMLNGFTPTNSVSSTLAYAGACLGDPLAWIASCLVMIYPCLKAIYSKKNAVFLLENRTNK
ncbi:MAG TPA: hypothetical protein DCZ41_03175 [Firmicutes bacterium]|nr:hypothetical protein [Bacillota bacterium]